jgi:hypothetical protein
MDEQRRELAIALETVEDHAAAQLARGSSTSGHVVIQGVARASLAPDAMEAPAFDEAEVARAQSARSLCDDALRLPRGDERMHVGQPDWHCLEVDTHTHTKKQERGALRSRSARRSMAGGPQPTPTLEATDDSAAAQLARGSNTSDHAVRPGIERAVWGPDAMDAAVNDGTTEASAHIAPCLCNVDPWAPRSVERSRAARALWRYV